MSVDVSVDMPTEGAYCTYDLAQRVQCFILKIANDYICFWKGHLTVNFGARVGDLNASLDQRQGDSNKPILTSLNARRIGVC